MTARPSSPPPPTGRAVLAGLLVVAIASCTGPPPATPGVAGTTWVKALFVERPPGMEATPPSISPVDPSGGGLGHPGHFSGQGHMTDVVQTEHGLVAVGFVFPDWLATAWVSDTGSRWARHDVGAGPASFLLAAATDGRRVVGVGRVGNDAAAWVSDDGTTWTRAEQTAGLVETPATVMTSVARAPDGSWVAGGWAGLVTQPVRARVWRSVDGQRWERLAHGPAFEDGRVLAMAAGPGGLVAVGTTGIGGRPDGSAVWTSVDGHSWRRTPNDAALDGGAMLSVTAGGPGLVAAGNDLDVERAMVWTSEDGRSWAVVDDQPSLENYGLKITIADVTAAGPGMVAVGHLVSGTQYPQGVIWTSERGDRWTRAPDDPVLGQGTPAAVIPGGPGVVAVGTVGAPDNFIPTVWLSPGQPSG